jgi:O-antigen ligase
MINRNSYPMAADNNPLINRFVMLALLGYPALLLTVRGGMNGLLFLLVIASLWWLFRAPGTAATPLWDGYSTAFSIAMASPILAVLLSQAYHGTFSAPPLDGPSRFLFAIPVFLALRRSEIPIVAIMKFAFPLGALTALIYAAITHRQYMADNINFVNHIHFGDMALMLGFLSLFSINWAARDRAPVLILGICGLLAGLYLSVQSEARGGWVAAPVLLLILWRAHNPKFSWTKLGAAALSILLFAVLTYALVGTVQHRIDSIYQDMAAFHHGNEDTSIGVRLQLWRAACFLFAQNPVFGVGPNGFAQMMTPLSDSGMLTKIAAGYGRGEVHNEILAKASELGIFGLLSLLSIYVIPLIIFVRAARSRVAQARTAAFMGICLVTGFFIFGLTVEIFNLKMTDAFYSLTVAVLLAAATHKTLG